MSQANILQGPPPIAADPAYLDYLGERGATVVRYFSADPKFELVRPLSKDGSQGGALVYNQRTQNGVFFRRIVVKYYNYAGEDEDGDEDRADKVANREYDILNMLRGAFHIVQLLGEGKMVFGDRIGLIMEYVAHGTLQALRWRFSKRQQPIPNQIIWRWFLCMIRACIAMKYPPRAALEEAPLIEEFPPAGTPPTNITHGDIHDGNILISELDPDTFEHGWCPALKFIDFGLGSYSDVQEQKSPSPGSNEMDTDVEEDTDVEMDTDVEEDNDVSIEDDDMKSANLSDIVETVLTLALGGEPDGTHERSVDIKDRTREINVFINTFAPKVLDEVNIEKDLRDLIVRCMASHEDDVPSLQEIEDICRDAIRNKTQDISQHEYVCLPDGGVWEWNWTLEHIVQQFVLDADYERDMQRLMHGQRTIAPARMRRSRARLARRQQWPY